MLWVVYEPAMDACLAMHLSRERTVFVCYTTTSSSSCRRGRGGMAESQYSHTDDARWYNNEAYSGWLRLRHYVYGTELKKKKNLMEWFIQQVKDRTDASTTTLHAERGIAAGSMCGTGSNCSCYIWTWGQTGCGSHYFWPGMEAKLTEPFYLLLSEQSHS